MSPLIHTAALGTSAILAAVDGALHGQGAQMSSWQVGGAGGLSQHEPRHSSCFGLPFTDSSLADNTTGETVRFLPTCCPLFPRPRLEAKFLWMVSLFKGL